MTDLAPEVVSGLPFGDVTLLGYEIDRPEVVAGTVFYVTLYWQATRDLVTDISVDLSLWHSDQLLSSESAALATGDADWIAGEVRRGPQRMMVPSETAPGTVTMMLRLDGDELSLGEIEVIESVTGQ